MTEKLRYATPWRIQFLGPQEADLISGGTFMGLDGGSGAPERYDAQEAADWKAAALFLIEAVNAFDAQSATIARLERENAELRLVMDYDLGDPKAFEKVKALSARVAELEAEARPLLGELQTWHANDAGDRAIQILARFMKGNSDAVSS